MPRANKPWYRADRNEYCAKIRGKLHRLGPDRDEAIRRFHELLAAPSPPEQKIATNKSDPAVAEVLDAFLDHYHRNYVHSSYEWYRHYLQAWMDTLPASITIAQIRPYHVQRWIDAKYAEMATARRSGVAAAKRAFRWSCQQGYIPASPLQWMPLPAAVSREGTVSDDEFRKILEHSKEPEFRDLLTAVWETGCRPREAKNVEARWFDATNARWVFPVQKSKGKARSRVVYLPPATLAITKRLAVQNPKGPIFLRPCGRPWNDVAIAYRFGKLTSILGRKVFLYQFRHSRATTALERGMSTTVVSELLGHIDGAMLSRHYSHLARDAKNLLEQARRAAE